MKKNVMTLFGLIVIVAVIVVNPVQISAQQETAVIRAVDPYAVEALNRANAAFEALDIPGAAEAAMEAIRLDPNYEEAYAFLAYISGFLHNLSGDKNYLDDAIEFSTQAIRINPNNAENYRHRGRRYVDRRNSGDFDLAIADFTQAIRLEPNHAQAYYRRGDLYIAKAQEGGNTAQGDWDRAIADFTQVIRLEPNNADAYFWRGFAYVHKRDRRVIADLESALRIDPNHADARELLEQLRAAGW